MLDIAESLGRHACDRCASNATAQTSEYNLSRPWHASSVSPTVSNSCGISVCDGCGTFGMKQPLNEIQPESFAHSDQNTTPFATRTAPTRRLLETRCRPHRPTPRRVPRRKSEALKSRHRRCGLDPSRTSPHLKATGRPEGATHAAHTGRQDTMLLVSKSRSLLGLKVATQESDQDVIRTTHTH